MNIKTLCFSTCFCLWLLQSCMAPNKLYYFHDQQTGTQIIDSLKYKNTATIQKGDRVTVTVSCPDPAQTAFLNPFNNQNGGVSQGGNGFLVDDNGQIDFPLVGKVNLINLTSKEAAELLKKKLQHFYKEPYVYVTLTGKVYLMNGKLGTAIPITNERLTIFEAIAQSGIQDLFDRRDEVWVVREDKNERKFELVNLNSKDIFQSPYYYLRSNDLVYIRPNRFYSVFAQNSPLRSALLGISSVLGLILLLRR